MFFITDPWEVRSSFAIELVAPNLGEISLSKGS
jgi:hypothetical protein